MNRSSATIAGDLFSGARRSHRFNINFNERLPLLIWIGNIWTVKRPKSRSPLNTYCIASPLTIDITSKPQEIL